MSNKNRIAVVEVYAVEGDLYALRNTEFPDQTTCDTFVEARTADGTRYIHRTFKSEGSYVSHDDGFTCVTPKWRAEEDSAKFIARVLAKGSIDPTLWNKVIERTGPLPEYWDEDEIEGRRARGLGW